MRTLCGFLYYWGMKNKYIYIDESGDTGYIKKSTKYFILTTVIVDDPFILRRIVKSVYKSKLDKNKYNILHAYMETNRVRSKIINNIKNIDIKSVVFVLNKSKLYQKDPYKYLLENVAIYFSKFGLSQIILARKETRNNYNQKLIEMFNFYNIKLILSTHRDEKSLQIADFYSWAVFSYLEHGHSDYFKYLENHTTFR